MQLTLLSMPHHVKATMSQVFSLQVLLPELKAGTARNDAVVMCNNNSNNHNYH